MLFSAAEIQRLLEQKSITCEWPWSTNDEAVVDGHIRVIIADVRRKLGLLEKTDYSHYGSGYASFVDCWLYRDGNAFRFAAGDCYWGLVVLFSRLSKYVVLGEGQKTWSDGGGTSYMPSFEMVDEIRQPAVKNLVGDVEALLSLRGLVRLSKEQLSGLQPETVDIPAALADGPRREFDALYYWED